MPTLERDGVRLVYDDIGSGPAVLLSHSWFCDARQWPQASEIAAAGYRVLNLDNRGHGRSGPCHRPFTLWDMADDLIAVLDHAAVDRAVLAGLSIGGFAALRAALRHPARVRGLVLADTSAGPAPLAERVKARSLGPLWRTPARIAIAPIVTRTLFGATTRHRQPALVATWRSRFLDQDPRSITVALDAVIRRDDITDRLPSISVPTLVIVGEEDHNEAGLTGCATLAARIPDADLVVIPDVGHLSALEAPREVTEEMIGFTSRLARSPND